MVVWINNSIPFYVSHLKLICMYVYQFYCLTIKQGLTFPFDITFYDKKGHEKSPSICKIRITSLTTRSHSGFTVILGVYRAFNGQYVYLNAHIIISWKTKMFPWSRPLVFRARGGARALLRNARAILINSAFCRTKI